jgi:inner membrane protein
MDSLTQIVLGAAVAEAVLGKRVGNRAMVWGAIAGTIPDLDVLANFFLSPIDALAFHRGPSHSFLFSIIMAFALAWLIQNMYKLKCHKWFGVTGWSVLSLAIASGILIGGNFSIATLFMVLILLSGSGLLIYKRYTRVTYDTPQAGYLNWTWMFFLALVTHPILDCFTTYGTQFLLPFSSQRIAFNNIAVVDPLYTVPFIGCLVTAMFLHKSDSRRTLWNNRGLIISSLYMILTIVNKTRVNTIFENSLSRQNITYSRFMTTPTILNNVLWSGIAETDSAYYYGMYSFFDAEKSFKLNKIEKNRSEFQLAIESDKTLSTLRWFSDDYFVLKRKNSDSLEYYDLRFGTFRMKSSDPDQFVFKFNMTEKPKGTYQLLDQGVRPRDADFADAFAALWARMMGRTI